MKFAAQSVFSRAADHSRVHPLRSRLNELENSINTFYDTYEAQLSGQTDHSARDQLLRDLESFHQELSRVRLKEEQTGTPLPTCERTCAWLERVFKIPKDVISRRTSPPEYVTEVLWFAGWFGTAVTERLVPLQLYEGRPSSPIGKSLTRLLPSVPPWGCWPKQFRVWRRKDLQPWGIPLQPWVLWKPYFVLVAKRDLWGSSLNMSGHISESPKLHRWNGGVPDQREMKTEKVTVRLLTMTKRWWAMAKTFRDWQLTIHGTDVLTSPFIGFEQSQPIEW